MSRWIHRSCGTSLAARWLPARFAQRKAPFVPTHSATFAADPSAPLADPIERSTQSSCWHRWGASAFTLDLRSLAVFRIGLGAVLLADLVFRGQVLTAMYSDRGILSRADLLKFTEQADRIGLWQWGDVTWSLHRWSGEPSFEIALFILAGVCAVLLALGWWTRVVSVASFVLLLSLHNRNPFILHSGDTMLRLTLFWTMFLPVGRLWSIDAWRRRRRGEAAPRSYQLYSAATAGLVFQVFILYFFTGVAKFNELWWNGDAMYVVLNLSIYVRDFGRTLRNWPWLLEIVAYATLWTEILFPPLLLVGYRNAWWRWLNLLTFCSLHLAVLCTMSIGLFSWICFVVWTGLVPAAFWNRWGKAAAAQSLAAFSPPAMVAPARGTIGRLLNYFCAAMIPYMLLWNLFNIFPQWLQRPNEVVVDGARIQEYVQRDHWPLRTFERWGQALGLGQHFQMFGSPYHEDPWFIYRATLVNGEQVDIFEGGRAWTSGQPLKGIKSMPEFHWRKLHHDLVTLPAGTIRQRLLDYQVEQWNQSHPQDQQVRSAALECYLDTVWPIPMLGELRGAMIWAKYPPSGPSSSAFDQMYDRVIGGGEERGY